ncbi:MAG: outer membrane beta-barrel protein [Burkholderiales bacterium]|nr:outer membrane beta-barrel protein [Burkholderiales bacterium]
MGKNHLSVVICALLTSAAFGATAQTTAPVKPTYEIPTGEAKKDNDGPRGWPIREGVALYPSIGFSFGRDDNLFLTNSNQKSSTIYALSPGLKLQARSSATIFTLDANLKSARYVQSRADDYTDYRIAGTGEFVLSSRMGLRLGAEYNKGHDPRGSNDRGISAEPDQFRNTGIGGLFAFGGNDARGRFEVEASSFDKRYTNNRATTAGSDRNTDSFTGRFFARIAEKTAFLVEARADKLDYKSSVSPLDSNERYYLAGVTWDATAATSGTVKVGQIRKDFASSATRDSSTSGWDAIVQWAPLRYSKFIFTTSKSFGESTGVGDFLLTKRYGASWMHEWNSRISTSANISRSNDDFVNGGRSDSTDSIGLKLNYKVQRWLTLGGEFSNTNRDSSNSTFNYKKNLYSFTVGATL